MSDTRTCFGCTAEIAATPGNYYCDACIATQAAAQTAEREAFDAFHKFADNVPAYRHPREEDTPNKD